MGGGYGQFENSEGGTLTVSARVSNGSSRHAMPSMPALVYAALLYKDGEIPATPESNFVQGTATEDGKLIFSFQRPDDTSGTFTLEICAFVKTEGESEDDTMQFSREAALLSGNKTGLEIVGDKIVIEKAIPLLSDKPGTVSLKIKVPEGCSLFISETNEDGATIAENDAHFTVTGTSPDFIIMQKDENGISAGAYPVTFTVKKGDEIVHIFSEYINVINGLCTNTWWNGEKSSEVKDVANSIAKTVYVRGTGGWYDDPDNKYTATASESNSGSFLSPLATIQKAVDAIIARNDGASEYTIYVDGILTQSAAPSGEGMADFSALSQNLTLTIKSLSDKEEKRATLDGGARFNIKDDGTVTVTNAGIGKRVIYAKPERGKLNLTFENLVIKGGNASDNGGGVYFSSTGGSLTMNGGEISGNAAANGGGVYYDSGKFTMTAGTISGNTATGSGGGIYSRSGGSVKISGGAIKENKANQSGGGIYHYSAYGVTISGDAIIRNNTTSNSGGGICMNSGSLDVKSGTISGNTATSSGGGIYFSAQTLEISGGTIGGTSDSDKNTAKNGGGVFVANYSELNMKDGTISGNTASGDGGGVYVTGSTSTFTMTGGTAKISGNTANGSGGGVYVSASTFKMSGGAISGNTSDGNDAKKGGGGVYVASGTFAMSDGTINGNTASNGNGAYLAAKGKLNMSGAAQFAESDDVYLYANGSDIPTITVAGALTAESPVATITPSDYTAGRQVLSAGTDVTIDDTVCGKFALTPAPDDMEWKIVPNDDGTAGALGIESVFLNSSSGDDGNSGLAASKAVKTLSKAIELFESQNAQKIMVCAKYTLPSDENALLDRMGGGKRNLTLLRYDGSSDVSSSFTEHMLTISSRGNVTITNVTLDGNKEKVTASGRLLYVNNLNATVTLGDGAAVCNNRNSGMSGSGACIYAGTFKMVGGKVTGNVSGSGTSGYGAGVYINSSARFEMSGGIISENYAYSRDTYGGGVYVGGTFEMSGGEISGNKAINGGGVFVIGTFKMEGGKIMDNTATSKGNGVYKAENATFTHTGGTVQSD